MRGNPDKKLPLRMCFVHTVDASQLFTLAPFAVHLVGIPDAAILVPAAHLAGMDRAPGRAAVLGLRGFARAGVLAPVDIRDAAILEQVGDGARSPLQELRAALAAQGDLALEAVGIQVADIPASRRFVEAQHAARGVVGWLLLAFIVNVSFQKNKKSASPPQGGALLGEWNWVSCHPEFQTY